MSVNRYGHGTYKKLDSNPSKGHTRSVPSSTTPNGVRRQKLGATFDEFQKESENRKKQKQHEEDMAKKAKTKQLDDFFQMSSPDKKYPLLSGEKSGDVSSGNDSNDDDDDVNLSIKDIIVDDYQHKQRREADKTSESAIINEGKEKGYPATIDIKSIQKFTQENIAWLKRLLYGSEKSGHFMNQAKAYVNSHSSDHFIDQHTILTNGWLPGTGYYGDKGWEAVSLEILRLLGEDIDRQMEKVDWMKRITRVVSFLDLALTPEIMVKLYMHENPTMTFTEAIQLLKDGEAYGRKMFRDVIESSDDESDYEDMFEKMEQEEQERERQSKSKTENGTKKDITSNRNLGPSKSLKARGSKRKIHAGRTGEESSEESPTKRLTTARDVDQYRPEPTGYTAKEKDAAKGELFDPGVSIEELLEHGDFESDSE